jgi:transcriptional regulator with XRE-family HTH domain
MGRPRKQTDIAKVFASALCDKDQRKKREIGKKIRNLREFSLMTKQELGERVGTSPNTIIRIERGTYRDYPVDLLKRIAKVFKQKQKDFLPDR